MPVYDYQCLDCGVFAALRPMTAFRDPCACPNCGVEAARVFLTMPAVAGMDPVRRTAIATNEGASHEPRRSHGIGCSCCSGAGKSRKPPEAAGGAKSFPKGRPWMISH
jgi:putative FmdB family regulatory protein